MSDFLTAWATVSKNEGGYANNPHDHGGQTYRGIARNNWPKWGGWKYVDGCLEQINKQPDYGTTTYYNWARYVNSKLAEINVLQSLVTEFYKVNFWKRLGEINNQEIATWVFDKNVNTGTRGSKWLQAALNITVDGDIGAETIESANKANPDVLLAEMKNKATAFYTRLAENDPSQAQFLKGWLARV